MFRSLPAHESVTWRWANFNTVLAMLADHFVFGVHACTQHSCRRSLSELSGRDVFVFNGVVSPTRQRVPLASGVVLIASFSQLFSCLSIPANAFWSAVARL